MGSSLAWSAEPSAPDLTACRAQCTQERVACRQQADERSRMDTDPPIAVHNETDYRSNLNKGDVLTRLNERPAVEERLRSRKMERYQACEDQRLKCSRACANASLP